jgi:hypothetical protein
MFDAPSVVARDGLNRGPNAAMSLQVAKPSCRAAGEESPALRYAGIHRFAWDDDGADPAAALASTWFHI